MSLYSEEEVILPKVLLGIRDEAFYSSGVYTVRFSGTKAEFDEIVTSSWAAYSNVNKLICKDGTFYLNEE